MAITGIVAEFNPLHKGHKLMLDAAKSGENAVVCAISGNFVQRGDTAVIPKQKRAEAALRCGADLVVELPVPWSMSTAQNFALGGVAQLIAVGCDEILFGSECGEVERLLQAAEILESADFREFLSEELKGGATFAAARERAAAKAGLDGEILSAPNDTLAVEYISAARRLGFTGGFRCVRRVGAAHDSLEMNPNAVSSTLIRTRLLAGDIGFAERFMPLELRGLITRDVISDIHRIENAVLAVLRTKTQDDFKTLPDISEGLENKLYFSGRVANSLDALYNMIKTKRYTHARVRRLVLSAFLGLDNSFFGTRPPYVRVLGFSHTGELLLKQTDGATPAITRVSQLKELSDAAQRVFAAECRATDLYSLSLYSPQECGAEYKIKLLKTECLS